MKRNVFLSLVLFFTLALCLSAPASAASFEDVSDDAYYASVVEWAVDAGVTNGIGNNQFGVNGNVTRAQAVTFLWRAMGTPASKGTAGAFEDVEPGSWYENAVQWAVENKITEGVGDNKFAPDGQVTRGQMITFLYRAKVQPEENIEGDKWYSAAELWAQSKWLLAGTAQAYSTDGECPRCDVVYYIWKEVNNIGLKPGGYSLEDLGLVPSGIDAGDPNVDHTPDVDYSGLHAVAG